MHEETVLSIQQELSGYETEELAAIWQADDHEQWSPEAFEAIERILRERLGSLPAKAPATKARQLIEEAYELKEDDCFAEAMALCDEALALNPDSAEAHNLRGLLLDGQHDPCQAIAAYREAVRLDPDFVEAEKNLSELLADWAINHKGEPLEAVYPDAQDDTGTPVPQTVFEEARQILQRAVDLQEEGDLEGAAAACEVALRLDPNYAEAHNLRGVLYDGAGDLGMAINEYHEAVRLDPGFQGAAANLSEALAQWYEEYGKDGSEEVDLAAMYEGLPEEQKAALAEDPRWGADIPGAFYLDEPAVVLSGWAGNRTRPGSSGYDPLASDFETAQVQGTLIRQMFTGQLRTRNPVYLLAMVLLAAMFLTPLGLTLVMLSRGQPTDLIHVVLFVLFGIPGAGLLWNVGLSLGKPEETGEG